VAGSGSEGESSTVMSRLRNGAFENGIISVLFLSNERTENKFKNYFAYQMLPRWHKNLLLRYLLMWKDKIDI